MTTDRPLAEWVHRARAAANRIVRKHTLAERQALHDRCLALDTRALLETPLSEARYVVLDLETTGFAAYAGDEICQLAMLEYRGLAPTGEDLCTLVRPARPIPESATAVHGISDATVADAPRIEEVIDSAVEFMDSAILVGHHIAFDLRFLNRVTQRELYLRLPHPTLDTMLLYLSHSGQLGHYELSEVAAACDVPVEGRHDAVGDARIAAGVFAHLARSAADSGDTVGGLLAAARAAMDEHAPGTPPA